MFIIAIGTPALTNTDRIAVAMAPQKQAATTRSAAATKADERFWQTFHSGAYDKIAQALDALTAAYLETPTEAVTAAHIALAHGRTRSKR